METKLTKKELLEQLSVIEKQELKTRNDLFYDKYKDLSFFQTMKKNTDWKYVIGTCLVVFFISMLDIKKTYFIAIGFPFLFLLAIATSAMEIRQRIKYMRKEREK